MKIAVASEGTTVAGHFGHCQNFNIYETEGQTITKEESIANPGHRPGFLPNYLNDLGVKVIIAGGIGGGAIDIFQEKNIEVVSGAAGDTKAAVQAYINGELKSSGAVCREHQHADSCGGHH